MTEASSERTQVSIQMYKAYLDDLGRIGGRHENVRKYYMSVMSALFVFLSMAGKDGIFVNVHGPVLNVVAVVGVLICLAWFEHMRSFGFLFGTKLKTVRKLEEEMELNLPLRPFTIETVILQERKWPKTNWAYSPITLVDRVTPLGFLTLFILLAYLK